MRCTGIQILNEAETLEAIRKGEVKEEEIWIQKIGYNIITGEHLLIYTKKKKRVYFYE